MYILNKLLLHLYLTQTDAYIHKIIYMSNNVVELFGGTIIGVFPHKLLNESWQQHVEPIVICFDLAVGSLLNSRHQFRPHTSAHRPHQ